MNKDRYQKQAEQIAEIADIAIDCFTNNPPQDFELSHIKQFVAVYSDRKNTALNPKPQFHNLTSLKYILNDILIYFQEGSGAAVEAFWLEVGKRNIGIKRKDQFAKILKRGRIKNDIEYNIVIDLLGPYIQTNKLNGKEIDRINGMISEFEKGG